MMKQIRRFFRIISILILFILSVIILGIVKTLVGLFSKTLSERLIFKIVKPFCILLRWICGVHIQVEGKENIPPERGHLVVGNHYSYVEIFSMNFFRLD